MATGKKLRGLFDTPKTGKRANIDLEVTPRKRGRPKLDEPCFKLTVYLFDRQVDLLDEVSLAIRKKTRQPKHRAEIIRALLDREAKALDPQAKDFDKTVESLFPGLLKG